MHRNWNLPLSPTQAESQQSFAVIWFRKNYGNIEFNFWLGYSYQNKLKFWSALHNEVKFNCLLDQKSSLIFKIWNKSNSPYFCLALFISQTNFTLKKWNRVKSHKRAIIAIYLRFIFCYMTFITGPLAWPLGRSKGRASLRESAFSLRESTNFYGTVAGEADTAVVESKLLWSNQRY